MLEVTSSTGNLSLRPITDVSFLKLDRSFNCWVISFKTDALNQVASLAENGTDILQWAQCRFRSSNMSFNTVPVFPDLYLINFNPSSEEIQLQHPKKSKQHVALKWMNYSPWNCKESVCVVYVCVWWLYNNWTENNWIQSNWWKILVLYILGWRVSKSWCLKRKQKTFRAEKIHFFIIILGDKTETSLSKKDEQIFLAGLCNIWIDRRGMSIGAPSSLRDKGIFNKASNEHCFHSSMRRSR